MPPDGTDERQPEVTAPRSSGTLERFRSFDRGFTLVKGLSLVTLASSAFVGYFQYLNAYQEKVSSQAKEDLAQATATFTEVSKTFAEIQASQQILNSDFANAIRNKTDASGQARSTKNALDVSKAYEKARITLRENIDVLARKAEIYIDWASDTYRDPAGRRNVNDDPLTRSLLRDYDFNCADKYNFPQFGNVGTKDQAADQRPDEGFCAAGGKQNDAAETTPANAFIRSARAQTTSVR